MKIATILSSLLLLSVSSLAAATGLPSNQIRMGWSFTVDGAGTAIGSGELLAALVTQADNPDLYAALTDPLNEDYQPLGFGQPFPVFQFYSVIDISGTIDGNTISSYGISFHSDAATDNAWNMYYDSKDPIVDADGNLLGGYNFHYRLSNTLYDSLNQTDYSQTGVLALTVLERPLYPVPLPAGVWLFASGLGALGAAARRRRAA